MTREQNSESRRRFLGSVSRGVVGTAVLGTVAASGISVVSTDRGPDPDDPHDDVIKEVIESDYAEIHSAATGAKTVDDQVGSANVAIAVPITYDTYPGMVPAMQNVEISVEPVNTPGDYYLEDIVTNKQGDDGTEAGEVLQYALDAAWSSSVGRVMPIPSPMSLIESNEPDITQDYEQNTIEVDYGGVGGEDIIAMHWGVDFHVGSSGTVPHGAWVWDVTIEGDVGHHSTSPRNPGFNKIDDISHTHTIAISVQDYA